MSAILQPSRNVVIDAGVAIWTVLPLMTPIDVTNKIAQWRKLQLDIYAPSLWYAETTSAIRRAVATNTITVAEGHTALEDLMALDVTVIAITPALCRAALSWAERLNHSKAYDGFYLALADELGATLYTTDQRLVNGAKQQQVTWVKRIDE